jgi:hypothetical protein
MPTAARRRDTADYILDEGLMEEPYREDDENVRAPRSSAIQSGWDAALKSSNSGQYTNDFRWTEDKQLVKFLGREPFAVYNQHWINERQGKKSFTCTDDATCPLCSIGDKPRRKICFSLVNLSAEEPQVEILTISPTTAQIFHRYDMDSATGPLDRMYYSLSKTGTGPKTLFNVEKVRPQFLEEEWKMSVADAEAIVSGAEALSDSIIPTPNVKLMEEVKAEITSRNPRRD